jgi:hypothetical protein
VVVLGLQVVNAFIGLRILPKVLQTAVSAGVARDLPAGCAFSGAKLFFGEILVEMLLVDVEVPGFAINDDTGEIGFGCGV